MSHSRPCALKNLVGLTLLYIFEQPFNLMPVEIGQFNILRLRILEQRYIFF